jgi:hypothetical protein
LGVEELRRTKQRRFNQGKASINHRHPGKDNLTEIQHLHSHATMSAITSQVVINHYSALARENDTRNAEHIKKVAESFGYSAEDLAGIPEEANLGVSCGNPLAVAGLKAVSCLVPFSFLSSIVGIV